uniref:Ricin B-type lectin domain-containing protein n=1 Tax=Heterorhabditis bacteriophora TaxID=37862 RepID=A0A1I7XMB9_HETBA
MNRDIIIFFVLNCFIVNAHVFGEERKCNCTNSDDDMRSSRNITNELKYNEERSGRFKRYYRSHAGYFIKLNNRIPRSHRRPLLNNIFNNRYKRSYNYDMLVDNEYDERQEEWKKYTCRKVRVPIQCSNEEKTELESCFKPVIKNLPGLKEKDGWHKKLTCKSSKTHNMVMLYVNHSDRPVSIGKGNTSKLIQCNNHGEWSTKDADNKWIVITEAKCITADNSEITLLDSIDQ